MSGVGRDILFLQAQQHHSVERVEACLNLVFLLVSTAVAQLYDKRQNLVVGCVVEGEFARLQQLAVQLYQHLHCNLVYLQMSLLTTTFLIHHAYQIAEPVGLLFFLFVGIVESLDILALNALQRAVECSHRVLHLPHIEQIFGNVCLS